MKLYFILIAFFVGIALGSCGDITKSKKNTEKPAPKNNKRNNEQLLFENDTIAIYRIDSASYFQQKKQYSTQKDSIPYIEDLNQVKKLLKGRITFGGWNPDKNVVDSLLNGNMPVRVAFDDGKIIEGEASTKIKSFATLFPFSI